MTVNRGRDRRSQQEIAEDDGAVHIDTTTDDAVGGNREGAAQDTLDDVPPSAKLVALVLDREGDLTLSQICDETRLNHSTTSHALDHLDDAGVVASEPCLRDARQDIYTLTVDHPGGH